MQYREITSLQRLCINQLRHSIYTIKDLKNCPFYLIKDILPLVNPGYLLELERYNPHIIHDTEDLWKRHCVSSYSDVREKYNKNLLVDTDWRNLYMRKKEEKDRRLSAISQKLRSKYGHIEQEKESRRTQVIDKVARVRKRGVSGNKPKTVGQSIIQKAKLQAKLTSARFKEASSITTKPSTFRQEIAAQIANPPNNGTYSKVETSTRPASTLNESININKTKKSDVIKSFFAEITPTHPSSRSIKRARESAIEYQRSQAEHEIKRAKTGLIGKDFSAKKALSEEPKPKVPSLNMRSQTVLPDQHVKKTVQSFFAQLMS